MQIIAGAWRAGLQVAAVLRIEAADDGQVVTGLDRDFAGILDRRLQAVGIDERKAAGIVAGMGDQQVLGAEEQIFGRVGTEIGHRIAVALGVDVTVADKFLLCAVNGKDQVR